VTVAVVTDRDGVPLAFAADGANVSEVWLAEPAVRAVEVWVPSGTPLLADKGYDSDDLRDELAECGVELLARHRKNRTKASRNDGRKLRRLRRRCRVERTNAWLKTYRRAGVRYEVYPHLHEGFIALAFAFIALNRLLK
jgi:IS5 family transposase